MNNTALSAEAQSANNTYMIEASKFEILLSYLFNWKHLIFVASAQKILYNHG